MTISSQAIPRSLLICVAIVALATNALRAQRPAAKYELQHAISNSVQARPQLGVGSITIVALLADFQTEGSDSNLTAGNGKFDLSTRFRMQDRDTVIDPPPHDSSYFVAHLRFLKNYYSTVSRGKLEVNFLLLPQVVHLSKQMKEYSPNRFDTIYKPLAELSREAWSAADSLGMLASILDGLDTARTMFMIFHAGAGRDIDLRSQFGFDPTPNDLPSIYFSDKMLRDALGTSFEGFALVGGRLIIRNTAILPEAETRTFLNPQDKNQTFIVQLGMNGLAASQVGSFLGLPDLFNTASGKTAIGQLGLMDGAGIFGYGGLFPPEPMAWEKMRLGWVTPVEVARDQTLSILAPVYASDSGKSQQTIFKIPISADEYYLLEVRRRDTRADGARFSTYQATSGLETPVNFIVDPRREPLPDSITGVLLNADEYDWAAFGDPTKGGIALWHIDESIIRAREPFNAINADPNNRAVKLVEGDGYPDVGISITDPFGREFTSGGYQNDFWFRNNPERQRLDNAHVNEFSSTSLPPTKSNHGTPSNVRLRNFSTPNNAMTVEYLREAPAVGSVRTIAGFPFNAFQHSDSLLSAISEGQVGYVVSVARSNDSSYFRVWQSSQPTTEWSLVKLDSISNYSYATSYAVRQIALTAANGKLNIYSTEDSGSHHSLSLRELSDSHIRNVTAVTSEDSIGPMMIDAGTVVVALRSGGKSGLSTFPADLGAPLSVTTGMGVVHGVALLEQGSYALNADTVTQLPNVIAVRGEDNEIYTGDFSQLKSSGTQIYQATERRVTAEPTVEYPTSFNDPAIADLDGDGVMEVVGTTSNKLLSYNYSGSLASNVYDEGPSGAFTSNPIVVDIGGTMNGLDVLYAKSGEVRGLNALTGKMTEGFPLPAGVVRKLCVINRGSGLELFALADSGAVLGWTAASGTLGMPWPMSKHDAQLTAHAPSVAGTIATEFFPSKRSYVWPNPVIESGEAHIRAFVGSDATASLLIVNDAGEKVTELSQDLVGGTDNEIVWLTKNVSNGVYTCRVKVTSKLTGETGQKLIKIAVIK